MDLSEPALAVLSPGMASVLRVLAGANAPFTVRQLSRMAGLSAPSASDIVGRLRQHGVVLVEEAGPSQLCRLNRDHLLSDALVALVTARQTMFEFLRQEIAGWAMPSMHASLFGSAARGDGTTSSDLDILVVHEPLITPESQEQWEQQLHDSSQRLRAATGNPVSWFSVDSSDLHRARAAGEPIFAEWQADAVVLHGQPLSRLLVEVERGS